MNLLALMPAFMAAGARPETITLSGTTGSPNTNPESGLQTSPDLNAGWQFNSDGTVTKLRSLTGDAAFNAGTEWSDITPVTNYWIRVTEYVAKSGDGAYTGGSVTLNTWTALSGNVKAEIDDPEGTGATSVTWKVEIATDSGGGNIVATGYYSTSVENA